MIIFPDSCSRLGSNRLAFQPYTATQLETIVRARLEGMALFDTNSVVYAARKVRHAVQSRICFEMIVVQALVQSQSNT